MLDHARDLEDHLVGITILLRDTVDLARRLAQRFRERCGQGRRNLTLSVSWRLFGSDTAALGMYALPSCGERRKGARGAGREAGEPDRGEGVEPLDGTPGVALLLDDVLHVPRGHVDGESWRIGEHERIVRGNKRAVHTVACDVRICARLRDVSAGLANYKPKLD